MKKPILTADKMVLDATPNIFDLRRLRDYFVRVLGGHAPGENEVDEWWTPLLHLRLATTFHERMAATIDGMLLFGKNPKRFLPQSGIRAICYSGASSAHARADEYQGTIGSTLCRRRFPSRIRASRFDTDFDPSGFVDSIFCCH